MKDYAAEFQRKIDEINDDSKKILIINAGSMDHGKTSLFNSLLDKDAFKADDIRTTVISQSEHWFGDVWLVDTPGLNAEEEDDREAYAAYQRANLIVFVHTAKIGELHRAEINAINNIKSFFEDKKFFWDHFCLVMTFLDADSEDNVNSILNKSLEDIKKHCGGNNFKTFVVSNSRYKKGSAENKKVLIAKSGILQFRDYLKHSLPKWRSENNYFRGQRIDREKKKISALLLSERENVQFSIDQTVARLKKQQQDFIYRLESVVDEYNSNDMELDSMRYRLSSLKNDLSSLRQNHQRDRARYDD